MPVEKKKPFYNEDIPDEKLKAIIKMHLEFEKVDKDIFYLYDKEAVSNFSNFIAKLKKKTYKNPINYTKSLFDYILSNSLDFSPFGIPAKSLTFNEMSNSIKSNYISILLDTDEDIKHNLTNILENPSFYIEFLSKAKLNKTRQKGASHFVKKAKQLLPKYLEDYEVIEINKDNIADWIKIISKDKKTKRMFVSNNDKMLTGFLNIIDESTVNLDKGIDLILIRNEDVNFAEVKEFSTNGGSQNHQFKDMVSVASEDKGFAICYGGALFQKGSISNKLSDARNGKLRDVQDITNGNLSEEDASQSNDIYPIENFIFYLRFLDIVEELIEEFNLDEEQELNDNLRKKVVKFLKAEDIDPLLYDTTFDEFVKSHQIPKVLRGVKIGEFFESASNLTSQSNKINLSDMTKYV